MRAHALGLFAALLLAAACGGSGWIEIGYGWGGYYDPYGYWDFGWYPYASAAGDFDGDGAFEIAVVDGRDGKVHVVGALATSKPEGAPAAPFIARPSTTWMFAAHTNADDRIDLVLVGAEGAIIQVYLGDGAGGFTRALDALCDACGAGARSVAAGRIDADAFTDLAILDETGRLHLLLGDGLGGFASPVVGMELGPARAGAMVVCADTDGDPGDEVVLVDATPGQVEVLSVSTSAIFERATVIRVAIPGTLLDAASCVGEEDAPDDLVILYEDGSGEGRFARKLHLHGERAGTLSSHAVDAGEAARLDAVDLSGDGLSDLVLVAPEAGEVRVHAAAPLQQP
jgi:hypothetical protein